MTSNYFYGSSDCIGFYQYSEETKSQSKKKSYQFKLSHRSMNRLNKKFGGFKMRKVERVKANGKNSFYVEFKMGDNTTRKVNIIRQCREYCKKHGVKFTKKLRKELEETMPNKLNVFLYLGANYKPHCSHDGEGPWYYAMIDEDYLEEVWLKKLHI